MMETWRIVGLWVLNFLFLQWFFVRLASVRQRVLFGDHPTCFRHVRWIMMRWIWPLTGWWSDFRKVGERRKETDFLEAQGRLWNMPRRPGESLATFRARISARMKSAFTNAGTREAIANALMVWPFCDHVEVDDTPGIARVTMTWFGKQALCEQMICEVAREAFQAGVVWTIHVRRWRWRWLRAVHFPWDPMTLRGPS